MLTMEGYRADGHKFATGQMAMNQDRPDKYSWGVSYAQVARLFCQAQGTLGIITKAAVTLKTVMPKSQVLFFSCKNINQALKALKAFMFTEETHEIFAVNRTYLNELLDIKALSGMPPWTVVIVIRGFDKEEIEYKHKDISQTANDLMGSINCSLYGVPNASSAILSEIQFPTGVKLHSSKYRWVPFVTIATSKQIEIAENLFPKNSGAILMPLQSGGCFYYQPDIRYRENETRKARKVYVDISLRLLKMGVLFPRPSALIAKQCAKHYPVNFKVLRSIKKTIDPKNIMNPGKLGL
jgi:FAD/FMN-containing dehydrogenase